MHSYFFQFHRILDENVTVINLDSKGISHRDQWVLSSQDSQAPPGGKVIRRYFGSEGSLWSVHHKEAVALPGTVRENQLFCPLGGERSLKKKK